MERPSHIHFDSRHVSNRLPLIGMALSFQVAALWLFVHGFSHYRFATSPPDLTISAIPETPAKQPVRPPEPVMSQPKPVTAEKPIFDTAPGERSAFNVDQRQSPTIVPTVTPPGADRAPVSITATHTVPPYPPIERRIGVEGKVTLRLTVNAEGRVSAAEVVTSSGREGLDQAAQQWIMAHWIYKPALVNGTPAASKALATVIFSLTNER